MFDFLSVIHFLLHKDIFSILIKLYQESKTRSYKNDIEHIPLCWNKHNGFSQRDLEISPSYENHNDPIPPLHLISGFKNLTVFKHCQFSWWIWKHLWKQVWKNLTQQHLMYSLFYWSSLAMQKILLTAP